MHQPPAPIAVYADARKQAQIGGIALGFVAVGAVFVVFNEEIAAGGNPPYPVLFVTLLGYVCVGFFGSGLLFILLRLARILPVLSVTERGIHDRWFAFGLGVVPWHHVQTIGIHRVTGDEDEVRFLAVELREPERIIRRFGNLRRRYLATVVRTRMAPIHISEVQLTVDMELLLDEIRQYHHELRRTRPELVGDVRFTRNF